MKTTNGGVSWFTQSLATTLNLNSVYFTDINNGWIVGDDGIILRTTNGGTVDINMISNEFRMNTPLNRISRTRSNL